MTYPTQLQMPLPDNGSGAVAQADAGATDFSAGDPTPFYMLSVGWVLL